MTPARLVFAALALALAAGCERVATMSANSPFASFESRCERLPVSQVDVVRAPFTVVEDNSRAYADLAALADASSPRHRTVGLTRGTFGYRSTLELEGLEDPKGNRACARPRVRVDVSISPMTVYVAREYLGDACREPIIREHEQRHVEVFERYVDEVVPRLARKLEADVGTRVRVGASIVAMQDTLKSELAARLDDFMANARTELAARHAEVDTSSEYERLARVCGPTP